MSFCRYEPLSEFVKVQKWQRLAPARADLEKTAVRISEVDVRGALRGLLDELRAKEGNVAEFRAALASQIDRVELDPESERCVIHYRLTTGVNLASPRG